MAYPSLNSGNGMPCAGTRGSLGRRRVCPSWAISLGVMFLGGLLFVSVCEAGSQNGPPSLEGGNTIGGPGLFIAPNGETHQVFDTDTAQPLCLTLTGEVGTTEASFDGLGTLQVAAAHSQAVCRDDKTLIELTCLEGTQCRTKWRVDTPAGEDEIQVNNVVNAPAGPQGPQGPEGPAGPKGPAGSIENATLDVVPALGFDVPISGNPENGNNRWQAEVSCPIGNFVIISAGYRTSPPATNGFEVNRMEIDATNNKAIFEGTYRCLEDEVCVVTNFLPIANCARIF